MGCSTISGCGSLSLLLLISVILTFTVARGAPKSMSCGDDFFLHNKKDCVRCTKCPQDKIVAECTQFKDRKCKYLVLNLNLTQYQRASAKSKGVPGGEDRLTTTVEGEDEYWKTLAFCLIGLLSLLIIATFIVLVFLYKKLQRSIVIRQSEEGDIMDDADSGYVVIRSIHHMSTAPRGDNSNNPLLTLYQREPPSTTATSNGLPVLLPPSSGVASVDSGKPSDSTTGVSVEKSGSFLPKLYQPQRRLLNYDADDVFESEDSAGGVLPRSSIKETLLPLVDEKEV